MSKKANKKVIQNKEIDISYNKDDDSEVRGLKRIIRQTYLVEEKYKKLKADAKKKEYEEPYIKFLEGGDDS